MDEDLQFGEVEETEPRRQLRPDQNAQFSVVPVGQPNDDELPIFIDLDALCEIETHANSDTRVELGGVLLGGQFHDAQGRPFVVIHDCLRAEHYEATRGSFKFTHDTWQEITRRRAEFHPDLQMVGWYHTHPDWGVFLSGMDLFICEHFFYRPWDVALVVDPCRKDRGYFVWTGLEGDPIRRTAGYRIFTSRHRREELEHVLMELEAGSNMNTESSRFPTARAGTSSSAPIIQVGSPAPSWQNVAVFGMLTMQFGLLVLLAWKSLLGTGSESGATTHELLRRWELERQTTELDSQKKLLQTLVAKWDGTSAPFVETLLESQKRAEQLESHVAAHAARERELVAHGQSAQTELERAQQQTQTLTRQIERLQRDLEDARTQARSQKDTIAKLEGLLNDTVAWYQRPWVWGGSLLLCLAVAGGAIVWKNR